MGSYLAHGPEIYHKALENLRAFSCISGPILESSIQFPWGIRLHHSLPLEKDLTSNPEVLETLGFFSSTPVKRTKTYILVVFGMLKVRSENAFPRHLPMKEHQLNEWCYKYRKIWDKPFVKVC